MSAKFGVYVPLAVDGYELCHPVSRSDFERINIEVNGVARRSDWTPIPMQLVRENEGAILSRSDSPWLGSNALIFRSDAIASLKPMLLRNGELLPLYCADANLVVLNP